jgi:4-hydroxy-3-polyprenylbenzoate decarboxylase
MATTIDDAESGRADARPYPDFHEHLRALDEAGLLVTIDRPINKDTEMHPLVRWQFRGGIAEDDRKAFLFTNIVDAKGRSYDMPVAIGALASNPAIYAIGMGARIDDIGEVWARAIANPIAPVVVEDAPCHEVVIEGEALAGEGRGLDALPIPISSPGFDSAPYLTATNCISRDPDTGVQNMGTYRAGLKAPNRLALRWATRPGGAEGYQHWLKYRKLGQKMPCAIVLGVPPAVAYTSPQKLREGLDELSVAGAIAGAPIRVVQAKTIDLLVPAESEIVIEGLVDVEYLEPEAPFGESHGHIALEDFNAIFEVTAITHRRDPVIPSIISQVTPSESSVIKRVAYEPLFLSHLTDHLGIKGVKRVAMHEPLTNLRRVLFIQFEPGVPRTEIWRALTGAANFQAAVGKYVIAVSDDIDPGNLDAVFWSLAYRADPAKDSQILRHRSRGHVPRIGSADEEDSALLIDATLKRAMPPVALPKEEYMEHARGLWHELGLPTLTPEAPWHGYSLGDWHAAWDEAAGRAVAGDYLENGRRTAQRRRKGVMPETPVRSVEDGWE